MMLRSNNEYLPRVTNLDDAPSRFGDIDLEAALYPAEDLRSEPSGTDAATSQNPEANPGWGDMARTAQNQELRPRDTRTIGEVAAARYLNAATPAQLAELGRGNVPPELLLSREEEDALTTAANERFFKAVLRGSITYHPGAKVLEFTIPRKGALNNVGTSAGGSMRAADQKS